MTEEEAINIVCEEFKQFILEKNRSYGYSIFHPTHAFSKANAIDLINVRMDDKLGRLMKGHEYGTEDTEKDLLGYLILKRAVKLYMKSNAKVNND